MQAVLLSVLSGCLLGIPFLAPQLFYLSWFAFVPLLFAIETRSLVTTYCLALTAGFVMAVTVGYWAVSYLEVAHQLTATQSLGLGLIFWLYSAQQVALPVLFYQWLHRRYRHPPQLLLPALIGLFSYAFPNLLPIDPALSQALFTTAIQATDLFGGLGLNIIITLSNVFIYQSVRSRSFLQLNQLSRSWPFSFIAAWFLYGYFSLTQWSEEGSVKTSPPHNLTLKIGIIQPNEIPRWEPKRQYPGFGQTFPPEMEMTQELVKSGADIVIWPEGSAEGYLDNSVVKSAYKKVIARLKTPLIFQDIQHRRARLSNRTRLSDQSYREEKHHALFK